LIHKFSIDCLQQLFSLMHKITMKIFLAGFVSLVLFSCDNNRFDSDKRQITVKNEIRNKIHRARSFDITAFKEDTLQSWPDPAFNNPIRYTIDFTYKDSAMVLQKKRGIVIFTPDGNSIISSGITGSVQ
jgi:hypothetical protein